MTVFVATIYPINQLKANSRTLERTENTCIRCRYLLKNMSNNSLDSPTIRPQSYRHIRSKRSACPTINRLDPQGCVDQDGRSALAEVFRFGGRSHE